MNTLDIEALEAGAETDALVAQAIGFEGEWAWTARFSGGATCLSGPYKQFQSREDAEADAPKIGECVGGDPEYWTIASVVAHPRDFAPSTDISAAWEVVEKMKAMTTYNGQQWCSREPWQSFCNALSDDDDGFAINFWNVTPERICRAALLTVKGGTDAAESE